MSKGSSSLCYKTQICECMDVLSESECVDVLKSCGQELGCATLNQLVHKLLFVPSIDEELSNESLKNISSVACELAKRAVIRNDEIKEMKKKSKMENEKEKENKNGKENEKHNITESENGSENENENENGKDGKNETFDIMGLPHDLILLIVGCLDALSIFEIERCNRYFYQMINNSEFLSNFNGFNNFVNVITGNDIYYFASMPQCDPFKLRFIKQVDFEFASKYDKLMVNRSIEDEEDDIMTYCKELHVRNELSKCLVYLQSKKWFVEWLQSIEELEIDDYCLLVFDKIEMKYLFDKRKCHLNKILFRVWVEDPNEYNDDSQLCRKLHCGISEQVEANYNDWIQECGDWDSTKMIEIVKYVEIINARDCSWTFDNLNANHLWLENCWIDGDFMQNRTSDNKNLTTITLDACSREERDCYWELNSSISNLNVVNCDGLWDMAGCVSAYPIWSAKQLTTHVRVDLSDKRFGNEPCNLSEIFAHMIPIDQEHKVENVKFLIDFKWDAQIGEMGPFIPQLLEKLKMMPTDPQAKQPIINNCDNDILHTKLKSFEMGMRMKIGNIQRVNIFSYKTENSFVVISQRQLNQEMQQWLDLFKDESNFSQSIKDKFAKDARKFADILTCQS